MLKHATCCMFATDCFAYGNGGVCKCLSDSNFGIKPCPFYKTVAQNEKECNEIKNRYPVTFSATKARV